MGDSWYKGKEPGDIKDDHLSAEEKQFLDAVKKEDLCEVKQVIGQVNPNCQEEDGMTALMFAAYKGNAKIVEYLLANGANVNENSQKDGYTSLMFATIAGSTEVVRLLLEAGAKTDVVNKVKRTASQLGAFVGRHDCVTLINNFVEKENITYYTKKHGLEEQAKLKEYVAAILHKYMVLPNYNPVKMVLFIQENKDLITHHKSVINVMETEVSKSYKAVNEILALKVHFLHCVLKSAVDWEDGVDGRKGGLDGMLKLLLRGRSEDGFFIEIENLLRNSIKSFPYSQSNIFQQVLKVLSKTKVGCEPSALSVITQSLSGIQSADFSECCLSCGERDSMNKCSICKMVRYCNTRCQKLHWSTHKRFCKELKKNYEIMQEEARKRSEEEQEQQRKNAEAVEREDDETEKGSIINDDLSELNIDENRSKVEEISET